VTRTRFKYDLFVFMFFTLSLFVVSAVEPVEGSFFSFNNTRKTFRTLLYRVSKAVGGRYFRQEFIETLYEKRFVHTLVPPLEKELSPYAVPFKKPFSGLFGFEEHVMLACADLDLDLLGLSDLRFSLDGLVLFASLVLKFTIISDLRNWGESEGRDLDKVEPRGLSGL
jgi:hypothetical protein